MLQQQQPYTLQQHLFAGNYMRLVFNLLHSFHGQVQEICQISATSSLVEAWQPAGWRLKGKQNKSEKLQKMQLASS